MGLIVADIGGTNARLAFQENINSEICLIENFLCSEFKSLEDDSSVTQKPPTRPSLPVTAEPEQPLQHPPKGLSPNSPSLNSKYKTTGFVSL